MKGYCDKILEIDLSAETKKVTPLKAEWAKLYLGGAGYACAELYSRINQDTDPLGMENPLMLMTGPLTGTTATSSGRMVACAKSPLTGLWGESNCGSKICIQIKKAGYDGILINGKAQQPVYIEIEDERVEIKSASNFWGKGTSESAILLEESLPKGIAMTIGPAGENLVRYATIFSEERQFGRTGMGAVMGSKNLKGLIIHGTKKIELAYPDEFKEHVKKTNKEMMEIFTYGMFHELGTSGGMDLYSVTGELPVKYYRGEKFEASDNISGSTLAEKYLQKTRNCYACPIGCGRVVKVGENNDKLPVGNFAGPEYETLAGFGSLILNDDLYQILRLNYLCNEYGIDTISAGGLAALLMDLYEQKKITASDLDGLEFNWGNTDAIAILLEKIAKGEGIGTTLALGPAGIIDKFNVDPEQIAAVNNSHVPFHDLRATFPMALSYAMSPHYGGSHNSCDAYMITMGSEIDDLGISLNEAQNDDNYVAEITAKLMEYRAFSSSSIMCVFANPPVSAIAEYLELAIGDHWNVARIEATGSRILALKRLLNLKLGLKTESEKIPKILLTPLPESGHEGKVPDFLKMKLAFYKSLDWDPNSGYPSEQKLKNLEIIGFN